MRRASNLLHCKSCSAFGTYRKEEISGGSNQVRGFPWSAKNRVRRGLADAASPSCRTISSEGPDRKMASIAASASAVDSGSTRMFGASSDITSDDHPMPDYHFATGQLKWLNKTVMVARPAVLYVRDVPIIWLPFWM